MRFGSALARGGIAGTWQIVFAPHITFASNTLVSNYITGFYARYYYVVESATAQSGGGASYGNESWFSDGTYWTKAKNMVRHKIDATNNTWQNDYYTFSSYDKTTSCPTNRKTTVFNLNMSWVTTYKTLIYIEWLYYTRA